MIVEIFIGTPMFGAQCAGIYTDSLVRLMDQAHGSFKISYRFLYHSSLIPAARNLLANEFMRRDNTADYLLFIDADIGFRTADVVELISASARYPLAGATAGLYLKKHIHWDRVQEAIAFGQPTNELQNFTGPYAVGELPGCKIRYNGDDPQQVDFIGMGFMLIPRRTLKRFEEYYQGLRQPDGRFAYFSAGLNHDGAFESEDVKFCRALRKMGMPVVCCPWVRLPHFGHHVFGGRPTEFVE